MGGLQALDGVGVLHPGGQPEVLREHAEYWQDLVEHLRAQHGQFSSLVSQLQEGWQGEAVAVFQLHATKLLESSGQAAEIANGVASSQQEHADRHAQALVIVRELAVQIAVTLAFIAAAAWFPPLLEVAEAQLALLVGTAGRVIRCLAEILSDLTRFLVRARQSIEEFSKLSVRTEEFSFGYGRLLVDGARDFAVDLMANASTSAIQHQPLTAKGLFTSAGLSAGVGGLFGGLETSGMKKVLNDTGSAQRLADGLPTFVSFGDQYKRAVKSLGRANSGATRPAHTARPASPTGPWGEYADARSNARALGVGAAAAEGERLAAALAAAQARHRRAVSHQSDERRSVLGAEAQLRATGGGVRTAQGRLADAEHEVTTLQALRDVYRASQNPEWIQDAERQLSAAHVQRAARDQEWVDSLARHEQAGQRLDTVRLRSQAAEAEVAREAKHSTAVEQSLQAWKRHSVATARVRSETSLNQQLGHAWRNNEWRQGFGSPKEWREYLLYDGVKDFAKGFTGNTVQAGIRAANGSENPGDIWRDALLGGTGGMMRGVLKGRFTNVSFPGGGIEEMVWKAGAKSLDKFLRDQIKHVIESEPSAGAASALRADPRHGHARSGADNAGWADQAGRDL